MLRGIVIRLIVLVAVPISFFSPFQGILLYLWYSHFRPNDFVWPAYSFKNGASLIAIATLLGYALFEMHRSPPRWRGLVIVTLFWGWIALATAFAVNPALALPKLSQYTNILIMTFLVAALANSESRIWAMLNVMGVSIGLLGLKAVIDFIITGGQSRARGVGGVELEANEFALALNMAIPILMGLSYLEDRRWLRYFYRLLAVFCLMGVVATFSRSGFLGLGLAVLLLAWYSKRRVLNFMIMGLAFVFLLPFAPKKALERYESIPTAAEVDPSAIARLQTWKTGLKMAKAHPIFGVGPLNFQTQYLNYAVKEYLEASNYHARAPHNAFVALAAESGFPSFLLFVSFIGAAIFEMSRLRKALSDIPGLRRLAGLCLTIQMTLMVYIVPNMFINRQNQDLMYHLIGISVGLAALAKDKVLEPDPQPDLMSITAEPATA